MAPAGVPKSFWESLLAAASSGLLLDYDGTLAPFREQRDLAFPYDGVRDALTVLANETSTRLVIISGRPVRDISRLLAIDRPIEIWGCHGWERMAPDGNVQRDPLEPRTEGALAEARSWALGHGLSERCEVKPFGLAFHWRGLRDDEISKLEKLVMEAWLPLCAAGLELNSFDGGLELLVAGRNKGDAVDRIITELGPDAVIAYLGDDRTDENAFRRLNGHGLTVLVRDLYRPTNARYWLRPPDELLQFLHTWRETASRARNK